MAHSRSWFREVDSMFCVLRILRWYGGFIEAGYLNYLLVKKKRLNSEDVLDMACLEVGLTISAFESNLATITGSAYLGLDSSGAYHAILFGEFHFLLYSPLNGEREYPKSTWRVPANYRLRKISAISPLLVDNEIKAITLGRLTTEPANHSTQEQCFLNNDAEVCLSNLPANWGEVVQIRMQQLHAYLLDKFEVNVDIVRYLHANLTDGILREAGNFRKFHLMRGGVIFVHPHEVEVFLEEWCERASTEILEGKITPLSICQLMSDFIGIHPFDDFNGKMSLLLCSRLLGERRILLMPSIIGKRQYYASMYAAGRGDFSLLSSGINRVLQSSKIKLFC